MAGYFITDDQRPIYLDVLQQHKAGAFAQQMPLGVLDDSWNVPLIVCLLDDLSPGTPAQAVVLEAEDRFDYVVDVALYGDIEDSENSTFRLELTNDEGQKEYSGVIRWDATALEFKNAVDEMPMMSSIEYRVSLGKLNHATQEERKHKVARWFVGMSKSYLFRKYELDVTNHGDLLIKRCELKATRNTVQVRFPAPLDNSQPFVRGSVCGVQVVHGFGYVVQWCEPRLLRIL